jgi:hypothetical protein
MSGSDMVTGAHPGHAHARKWNKNGDRQDCRWALQLNLEQNLGVLPSGRENQTGESPPRVIGKSAEFTFEPDQRDSIVSPSMSSKCRRLFVRTVKP